MSAVARARRRRRALVLGGLAVTLGAIAASDMAGRERALREQLGPTVDVLVAGAPIAQGAPVRRADLAVAQMPARYAPAGVLQSPAQARGLRARVAIAQGTRITDVIVGPERDDEPLTGAPVDRGQRIAEVVAAGSAELVVPGTRVDVLVSREAGQGSPGGTVLALQDVEVLAVAPVTGAQSAGGADATSALPGGVSASASIQASLRVTLRQAVYLGAAQNFAREIRLLPRPAGDRRLAGTSMAVAPTLER